MGGLNRSKVVAKFLLIFDVSGQFFFKKKGFVFKSFIGQQCQYSSKYSSAKGKIINMSVNIRLKT